MTVLGLGSSLLVIIIIIIVSAHKTMALLATHRKEARNTLAVEDSTPYKRKSGFLLVNKLNAVHYMENCMHNEKN